MIIDRDFECQRGENTIRGRVLMPFDGETVGNLPIAIISHEFKTDLLFSLPYARRFAELGFAAFVYDFCGGSIIGSSTGKQTDMSVLTEMDDLYTVIDFAKSQPYTDSSTVILMGNSQGGLVTALVSAQLGCKSICGIVLQYPGFIIPGDVEKGHLLQSEFDPENVPDEVRCGFFMLGKKYIEDALKLEPYEAIKQYKGNVLIIHGSEDKIVDLSYSQKALEVYRASGANAELKVIEGATHIFKLPQHIEAALNYIEEFAYKIIPEEHFFDKNNNTSTEFEV